MSQLERSRLYETSRDFFEMHGSAFMILAVDAAIEVCLCAAERGFVVARVEGGIWHAPGFEARIDCIWDGMDPPVDASAAHRNNLEAAGFIARERSIRSAFVLTAPPLSGWPHKSSSGRTDRGAPADCGSDDMTPTGFHVARGSPTRTLLARMVRTIFQGHPE